MNNSLTKIIPILLSEDINNDSYSNFFKIIKDFIGYKSYYVFLLNSEDIQLKDTNTKLKKGISFDIPYNLAKDLLKQESYSLLQNDELLKIIGLKGKQYVISKLSIKDTVYGFILFENYTCNLDEINSITSILSYKIKDTELSNVFKIQQKALKNAVEETHKAYKTIKNQNKKILNADKIKNEFLASVSHELRTPLNAIIGFSDILKTQKHGELTQKQQEYINDIQVSGIQLLGMVNEILDITKIEANAVKLVKRYFEISRPIIETSNLLMPLVKSKNINLTYTIENDIDIYADYQKIQQVLYNLISNAIKYTPDNGNIKITVTNTRKKIKISVKDSGIGIDRANHRKIFQKFVQLEDAFYKKETSTGLGLTITKRLVEMHHGKIQVESEKGQGANFIITLPIDLSDELQA